MGIFKLKHLPHSKLPFNSYIFDAGRYTELNILDLENEDVAICEHASDLEYLIEAANYFQAAVKIILTLKQDAEMALNEEWDKSDEGFKAQISIIDKFLTELS